eukprot:m51a1_g7575 putative protein kinase domain containing protein (354) ;mRNA; f:180085-181360
MSRVSSRRATRLQVEPASVSDVRQVLVVSPKVRGTPAELRSRYRRTGAHAAGRFGTVEILAAPAHDEEEEGLRVALKRQHALSPADAKDVPYREWRVFNRLAALAEERRCVNFVAMIDWYVERRDGEAGKFVDLVLEYAHKRLDDVKATLSIDQYREVVFQIVWALCTAQKRMQFMHCDLHAKNVLLQVPERPTLVSYERGGETRYTAGWIVKITDFGLSYVRLEDGTVVCNPKDLCPAFTETRDAESLARMLSGVRVAQWDGGRVDEAQARKSVEAFKAALTRVTKHRRRFEDLLDEDLFEPLAMPPDDGDYDEIEVSFDGDAGSADTSVESLADKMRRLAVEDQPAGKTSP